MKYEQYPSRSAKRNYFPLPNEIFTLGLSTGEIATYAYLMRCEDRETYQCYPSFETIGEAIGKTKNTVMKYVRGLEEKHLIYTEPTTVWGEGGRKRNGNLLFTIRPIEEAKRYRSGIMWNSRCGKTSEKGSQNRWHNPVGSCTKDEILVLANEVQDKEVGSCTPPRFPSSGNAGRKGSQNRWHNPVGSCTKDEILVLANEVQDKEVGSCTPPRFPSSGNAGRDSPRVAMGLFTMQNR